MAEFAGRKDGAGLQVAQLEGIAKAEYFLPPPPKSAREADRRPGSDDLYFEIGRWRHC